MGRLASITLDDVRNARTALVLANKPHGIIAIRKHIGHGSPQLISKLLSELDEDLIISQPQRLSSEKPSDIGQAWQTVSEGIENLIQSSDAVMANVPSTTNVHVRDTSQAATDGPRMDKLEHLLGQQQAHLERIEALNHKLEEQLMQQQDLFDSWRHEQHAERQLLKTQLEQLTQFVAKKPVRKVKKKTEQLDLYRDGQE